MPDYTFTFPAAAAGLTVDVRDANGDLVVTGDTLGRPSEVQGPVVLRATLHGGTYVATATDEAIYASFRAPGVLDVTSSMVNLGNEPLVFGANSGGSIPAVSSGEVIAYDDVPDGYEPGTTFDVPDGLYAVYLEFDFTAPAETRHVAVRINGVGTTPSTNGPFVITPGTNGSAARNLYMNTILIRTGGVDFGIALDAAVDSDVVDPEPLAFSYAWVSLTKIA